MKRIPGVLALVLCLCASWPSAAEAPRSSRRTIYTDNPLVTIGAASLDVTKPVEAQIPAGWRHADAVRSSPGPDPYRLVKFSGSVGTRQREILADAGYTIVSYHPFNSFLVRPGSGRPVASLDSLEGVTWNGPFHPYFKITDVVATAIAKGDAAPFVVSEGGWGLRFSVRLQEKDARPQVEASVARAPGVLSVLPTAELPLRVRVDPAKFNEFVQRVAALPGVVVVEPWFPRKPHNDENVQSGQSGVCVNNGNEAPNAPIFAHGITGWNARLVVADSCTDANEGWWYDDALQRLPAHETTSPWNSSDPDWGQRKILEYYDMYSGDTTMGCAGGDQHGTHVAGTVTGNCSLDAEGIATQSASGNSDGDQDGMAPGAKLIVQDLGNGTLAHLSVDGGSVGGLFTVAYENTCDGADCGIDAHNNSWGSASNAYDSDAFSGDDALWNTQRGLIVTSAGNEGSSYNTINSPGVGKNVVAVGNATNCNVDILAGGSSRGKTSDNRLKPDVVAGGSQVSSAVNDGNGTTNANGGCTGTNTFSGTSMSSPTVTGYVGLIVQYFNDGFYPSGVATPFDWMEPSGPMLKAMLINTAQRMTEPTTAERNGITWPNMDQGWGYVVLDNALYFPGDDRKLWVHDERVGVDVSGTSSRTFTRKATSDAEPLKVTLVWFDTGRIGSCGGSTRCLDNDLDLTVTEQGTGKSWSVTTIQGSGHRVPRTLVPGIPVGIGQTSVDSGPDDRNSVEQIIIYDPVPGRNYDFTVTASNTPAGSIPFALVATGDIEAPCTAPTGAAAITAADVDTCENGGVQVSWNQDPAAWNDGGTGSRSYRVIRDGLPVASGACSGNLPYPTTSCIDSDGPDNFSASYRVEYVSGCGTTLRTAESAATDGVGFFVDVQPDESSVCPGDSIVLTADVTPAGSYTYQWTEDGVDMAGETASALTVTKGSIASHTYNCRVTDTASCANVDLAAVPGTWLDSPPNVEFAPASVPQTTLGELCGDGDNDVEPGEIWGLDVGVQNTSLCTTATDVTADLELNFSVVDAEVCNPNGDFGQIAPQAQSLDGFAFKVDEAASCPAIMTFDVTNINWAGGGGNVDNQAFTVTLSGACNVATTCSCSTLAIGEVSGNGAAIPLIVTRSGSLVDLSFQKTGAANYNVYVSTEASTQPFAVGSSSIGKKDCDQPWNSQLGGKALILDYDVEAAITGGSGVYYILVTGDDGPATEGPLGETSEGAGRTADTYCAD